VSLHYSNFQLLSLIMGSSSLEEAKKFVTFLNCSRSHFNAVETVKQKLQTAGFIQLYENQPWTALTKNKKYFYTRNGSSIVAFAIPPNYVPGDGINLVGAHTDSPNLKLKPINAVQKMGMLQVGVETYGGGLWFTWFDRDLTLAGRVIVATKQMDKTIFEARTVSIDRPILRIPTLAIHLDRSVNEAFKFNTEDQLLPILATTIKAELEKKVPTSDNNRAHSLLIKTLADELQIQPEEIVDYELSVCDAQPSAIGGLLNEFIFSARLDNLMCSYCAIEALLRSTQNLSDIQDGNIRMVALFDNEECGSESAHGAHSTLLQDAISRILSALMSDGAKEGELIALTRARSMIVSADMAHAVHPNYASKHHDQHRPLLGQGVVIKHNANQRYATNSVTHHFLVQLAKENSIPYQEFVVRNDSPCGTTIGPIVSSKLGIRCADIGLPQLSMHSIRETAHVDDVLHGINFLTAFFNKFAELEKRVKID
jgi:aspartyl aminopeptidase